MKTIHPEMIKILSVKTLKSSVSATEDYVNNQVKPAGVEINVGLKTACSIAAKNIRVRLSIELNSTMEKKKLLELMVNLLLNSQYMLTILMSLSLSRMENKLLIKN
jgi:hypothetical protein